MAQSALGVAGCLSRMYSSERLGVGTEVFGVEEEAEAGLSDQLEEKVLSVLESEASG
ncbi:hypothetical protein [Anabaena azotica]|uniref:Uncharacterized protein n=1 Tax=Anabaena azotica FACHB-119 TaxID=947527 RepID=A0ABR8DDR2_9NOST|nr:hypothetical protein [Anabaena azotica]MBD2505375.1 hypothetical protein [Anabaena azotica FACHB-119]